MDFFNKCGQIRRKLWIWSHLLKKSLMENFIFCAVDTVQLVFVAHYYVDNIFIYSVFFWTVFRRRMFVMIFWLLRMRSKCGGDLQVRMIVQVTSQYLKEIHPKNIPCKQWCMGYASFAQDILNVIWSGKQIYQFTIDCGR